ncbi:S41 family peptidase [Paenibacillus sp. MMS20-IR301]|uniref:S41 family peptidase n=1 Tax=Paenibacillus sp. MMS20-IR301 TaxID=2895946 RepID=UPI0028E30FCA|nr:S41 family peptidase [Paenibacillus sp. MMS20-IR301]WNS46319.1 S41 family peptidase [Paenibacillus sp. MMS20-IR301]
MKKILLLSVLLVLAGLLFGAWLLGGEGSQEAVPELTAAQKREDFAFLAKLVKEAYPLGQVLQTDKGLADPDELSQDFITRAGKTPDNAAFLELFFEYMTFLGQAGHAQAVFDEPYEPLLAYFYNIDKQAYRSREYWRELAAGVQMYVYSEADIYYEQGKYVLKQDYYAGESLFPAGSVIKRVDGLAVEAYAKSVQTRLHLAWDAELHQVYLQTLLGADPGTGAWLIEAVRPDGTVARGDFPVYQGYKPPYPDDQQDSNVITRELDGQTGYIKIFSFAGDKEQDGRAIQEFMQQSAGKYSKLIIDLRRNGGGEDDYWADNLVKPLLQAPVDYVQSASVKKSFLERYGLRFRLYKQLVSSTLTQRDRYDVTGVTREYLPDLDSAEWVTYRVTKHWEPENSFPFNGKLVVLVDNDSFSAADNFTAAVRKLGLGTVAGTNTGGGACVYMEPYRYALPNSGLMFKLETDLNRNAEGQINEIYGTQPDVLLESSRYPTAYPAGYDPEELKQDEWVRKVMEGL